MAPHVQPKCFWHPQRLINNRQTGLSYQVWSHKGSNFLVLSFWQKRSWLQLWNIMISVIRGSVKKRTRFWCWCWWGGGESHSRMLDSNWRLTWEAERQVSQRHIFTLTIYLHLDHPHLDHLHLFHRHHCYHHLDYHTSTNITLIISSICIINNAYSIFAIIIYFVIFLFFTSFW